MGLMKRQVVDLYPMNVCPEHQTFEAEKKTNSFDLKRKWIFYDTIAI